MNAKKLFVLALIILLTLALPLAAAKGKAAPQKSGQSVQIAPQVAAVMDANVALRTNRSDIPLTYLRTLFLTTQQNLNYPVFMFQLKNADLGFAAPAETPDMLKASNYAFIRVYRLENGAAGEIVRQHFIRFDLEEKLPGFQPEAVNYYSIAGDTYPAGTYLLALALCTTDFSKITTHFVEFSLPDFSQLKDQLATTPIFSVSSLQMLPAAETKLSVHKNSFVYNTLLLAPVVSNEFKPSENLDLFYFILGAKPDTATNALSLQITYVFKKDGKEVNKLPTQTVNSYIISQPIDFTFTEVTKNAKGVETERKQKLLEAGDYVLEIQLLDTVSKAKSLQEFKFKIVQ
ncbi:MAG: hypothetical protein MUC72_03300 [Acidobacteria bacterium]|jgi:hypothetical protein|nr:hypothetical protein [Acidobacteriota bacterium]